MPDMACEGWCFQVALSFKITKPHPWGDQIEVENEQGVVKQDISWRKNVERCEQVRLQ